MSDDDLFKAIRDILVGRTGTWSINKVYAAAQGFGFSLRRNDALPLITTALGTSTASGTRRVQVPVPDSGTASLSPAPPIPVTPSLRNGVKPNGRARKPKDDAWVLALKRAVNEIAKLEMHELTVEQRHIVGRYHALKYENYSSDEAKNKDHGKTHASQYAKMAADPEYRVLTVRAYFEAATRVAEATGTLLRSPWDFRAGVLYEPLSQ